MKLKLIFCVFVYTSFILLLTSCGGDAENQVAEAAPTPTEVSISVKNYQQGQVSAIQTQAAEQRTVTKVPPTATPVPPTIVPVPSGTTSKLSTTTPIPPSTTSVPPTVTSVSPTVTSVPPTVTSVPPTVTPVPPTPSPEPSKINPCDHVPDNYKNDCQKNPCKYIPDNLKEEAGCNAIPPNQKDNGSGGGPGSNPCDSVPDSAKSDCQKNPCKYVPEAAKKQCEASLKNDPKFGSSNEGRGGGNYVPNFDPANIPQVAVANFTELDKFSRISKIRSGVGHDFSVGTSEYDPTHANCKSMKHYFMPMGVPLKMELYNTPHAFEWMSIKMFAPVDGTIKEVYYSENSYGTEARFGIESSEYPGYTFRFFHIALDPKLTDGSSVQAGQQIGTIGEENTWGEIAVQVQVSVSEVYLISFLQVASDNVLQEYKSRGVKSAADVIVTREQRDANPLACDDSEAGWFIGSGRQGTPEDMNYIVWAHESTDNWFFFEE